MASQIEEVDLAALRTLAAVVECASFTEASRRLGLTPSGVSKQIARLEAALGARLLERTTRRVRATRAGMELYRRVRPLFEGFQQATAAVRDLQGEIGGVVRLSASPAFGRTRLLSVLGALARAHPALRFDVVLTSRRLDFVEDEIDVAIREGPLGDSSLTARKLGVAPVHLYAAPAYLAARGRIRRLADLAHHDVLLLPSAEIPRRIARLVRLQPRFRVNDLLALRELAEAGAGVAPLPEFVAEDPLARGALVRVLPATRLLELPIHAVYPGSRFLPRRVQVVLDALAGVVARGRSPR